MACGTLCVTTDGGDAALIVGKKGRVVPSQDSQILAAAIMQAIEVKKNNAQSWLVRKEAC